MSVDATFNSSAGTGVWSAPGRALRLEKPRETSGSGGECRSEQKVSRRGAGKSVRLVASQFDTAEYVPLWNGPLLSATFAAQVIGQATDTEISHRPSPRAHYRAAQIAPALLLDCRA